jgi:glycosyltransferase involved in cell wall biosynthesis
MSLNKLPAALVIPAYNEADKIVSVLKSVIPLVNAVIVVDDGSRDQTAELAEQAGAIVLRHLINRGQGAALRTGTKSAISSGHFIIVHYDADGQFKPEDIAIVVQPLLAGEADIVFGSRFIDSQTKMPALKKIIIMPLARLTNRLLFGIKTSDPQSGFRAFTAEAAKLIDWQQDGMAHCSEILSLAHQQKLKIKEVPITVIYHEYGQRFSGGLKILKDLLLGRLIK